MKIKSISSGVRYHVPTGVIDDFGDSNEDGCICKNSKSKCYNVPYSLIIGLLLIGWGIFSIILTPFDIFMTERLKMMPGLPAYNWWKNTPDEVLCRIHIFNITNAEKFLSGEDAKLRFQEVGPIVYRENLLHSNISFNDNGTLSYTATRTAIFVPEMNTVDLNATIVVPNLAALFIPSYLYDASFITKFTINLLFRRLDTQPIITTTIYNYLWNNTDPILDVAQKVAPYMVPTRNMGILTRLYENFIDNVTVHYGTTGGHSRFFMIDKYDGTEYLPGYGSTCQDKVQNSTEGVCYPQFLSKNDTLKYWRKSICKVMHLKYQRETELYNVKANRYVLATDTFDRTEPEDEDCYQGTPRLPSGLADISPCYFGVPMATSFPHYLYGDRKLLESVDGLNPDVEKHGSYLIVEPTTGVPLQGKARSQSNLVVRDLKGYHKSLQKFSDKVLPLCWIEYHQVGIPWYVEWMMYFTVIILPKAQMIMTVVLLSVGTFLSYNHLRKEIIRRSYYAKNAAAAFEKTTFLKNNQ